jgi:hypothetical protein
VLTDGLPAVEAACSEAIGHGVHSADVVLNILARQRDPAPPVTIRAVQRRLTHDSCSFSTTLSQEATLPDVERD